MTVSERERVKSLVDLVPERDLDTVAQMLRGLAEDPVSAAFESAPLDDEDVSEEAAAALRKADADIAAGRVHSHEEVLRKLGL